WNLYKLAQTLIPLVEPEEAETVLDEYQVFFTERFFELMREKLGFQTEQTEDAELISDLFEILQVSRVDYTVFFRRLGDFKTGGGEKNDLLQGMFVDPSSFDRWAKTYLVRLTKETSIDAERRGLMRLVNPKFVLRNHIAQTVIEFAQGGDYTELNTLLEVLKKPFDEQPTMERFAEPPPEGSERIAVSCSS
ncbi:MAG: protein adenylyltransferase SelO family protein, partial [Acidobacteriota bacterium]|nr:protein adenylyltransferase SelO family protein [Acidobacteriota bacterium]